MTSKKPSQGAQVYLRFLQLAEAIRGLPALDPLEERILARIARTGQQGERLCVRDMLAQEEFGAPATIHNRLKSMRSKGWIALADTEDTRRKQIELTQPALDHFARLSRLMVKAAKS